jgi:5-methyltetrahydropteroyltriglutamate--homocysteine methyltransferase
MHELLGFAALHTHAPDASFDGGDLDCGSGLLLMIRSHIDPLPRGGLLEIVSTEISVKEDLPAWCRLTGNELVSVAGGGGWATSFLVCKGALTDRAAGTPAPRVDPVRPLIETARPTTFRARLPEPSSAPAIPPLAVMGLGSWPRPRWMVQAVHDHLEGRLPEAEAVILSIRNTRADAEKAALLAALKKTGNNKARAADLLGIHRTLLYKKMKQLGLPLLGRA